MKILIVDDEYLLRRMMREILSEYGECHTVVNGREAIEAFKTAHYEKKPYDIITMDIIMPEITGIEVLKEIRKWEESHHIPDGNRVKIIMITGSHDKKDFFYSFSEGCEAYVVKPFGKETLFKALKSLEIIMDK